MGKSDRSHLYITSLNPEVTGSLNQVVVQLPNGREIIFIVDCGLFQEDEYNYLNREHFAFDCSKVNFVIITHNHADHMARLPLLAKEGYRGKYYATTQTAKLMPIALGNSFQILNEDAKKRKEKPLYDEFDLENVRKNIIPCELGEVEYVDPNVKVTFFDNGHLIGAAMVLVQISYPGEEDINLFFTGDYKPKSMLRDVDPLPDWVYELPVTVVTEATYGYMDSDEISYHFVDDVIETVRNGRTAVIFVFAQGRAQEVIYELNFSKLEKRLNSQMQIKLDGKLAHEYTRTYLRDDMGVKPEIRELLKNYEPITPEMRQEIIRSKEQQIILTTSGMADHGPAQVYVPEFVTRSNVDMYFTGYTAEKTLGYKLQHPEEDGCVTVMGRKLKVNAQIKSTNEFSSHAKADEIIELLQRFKHLNFVLINHGETQVKEQFAERVANEVHVKKVDVLGGNYTFKVSRYGYLKHMFSRLTPPKTDFIEDKKTKKSHPKAKKVCKVIRQFFAH